MMQPADLRDRDDPATARRLDLAGKWRVAFERQVRSRLVVVGEIFAEDPKQVRFVEHDHVIQALAANRADEPLDVRALPR